MLKCHKRVFRVTNAILPSCSAVHLHFKWDLCNNKIIRPTKAELGHLSLTSNASCTDASCTLNYRSDCSEFTYWSLEGHLGKLLSYQGINQPSNQVKEKWIFLLFMTLINTFICQNDHAVSPFSERSKAIKHTKKRYLTTTMTLCGWRIVWLPKYASVLSWQEPH